MDCIFCRIVAGEIPADIVYQDNHVLVFRDRNPQAPVHLLLIPRVHRQDLLSVASEDGGWLAHLFQTVIPAVAAGAGLTDRGFRLVANTKAESGQSVFHLHFHLLGGRPMRWPPG